MVSSTVDLSLAGTKQAQEKTPKHYISKFYHHPRPSLMLRNSFNNFFCKHHLLSKVFVELYQVIRHSLYVILKLNLFNLGCHQFFNN